MSASEDALQPAKPVSFRSSSMPIEQRQKIYSRSCCECLLLALYLALFLYLSIMHMSIGHVSTMERTMKTQLLEQQFGNHSYTVNSIREQRLFWQWLEEAVLPVVVAQEDVLGHTLPREDWGYIVDYNKIIGGIRMMQERSQAYMCAYSHAGTCYPADTSSIEPFGYPACNGSVSPCFDVRKYDDVIDLEHDEGFSFDPYVGKFEFWLDALEPQKDIKRRLEYLADRHWIDKQTKTITIEILTTNQQYEPLISLAIFKFMFDRTGYIDRELHVETVPGDPYASNTELKILTEVTYVLFTFMFNLRCLKVFRDAYAFTRSFRQSIIVTLQRYWYDIFNAFTAIGLITIWVMYVPLIQQCSSDIAGLRRPANLSHSGSNANAWLEYHHELAAVEKNVEHAIAEVIFMHRVSFFALFALMFRFVIIWEGIPAMSTVVITIRVALPKLIALAAASTSLLFLYSGMGVIAFGAQLEEFSSVLSAFPTTAMIVVTADSDVYEKQKLVDEFLAVLWFWTLIALLFIVVLNLTLGVLVDAASASQADNERRITLIEQLKLTLDHYGRMPSCGCWCKDNTASTNVKNGPDIDALAAAQSDSKSCVSIPIDAECAGGGNQQAIPDEAHAVFSRPRVGRGSIT
eukprot:TRINITY_DN6379_c0_g1_i2.p1 TRINITY_DN6379_c0_g1~~TRINITY_DN6379_c0_g1_i2.p1  ORF type:complete len:632 (-),score=59.24 TRINITY_DN6379_c0_g1_i2:230-2125(-)